jgi:hypothetical protein
MQMGAGNRIPLYFHNEQTNDKSNLEEGILILKLDLLLLLLFLLHNCSKSSLVVFS